MIPNTPAMAPIMAGKGMDEFPIGSASLGGLLGIGDGDDEEGVLRLEIVGLGLLIPLVLGDTVVAVGCTVGGLIWPGSDTQRVPSSSSTLHYQYTTITVEFRQVFLGTSMEAINFMHSLR